MALPLVVAGGILAGYKGVQAWKSGKAAKQNADKYAAALIENAKKDIREYRGNQYHKQHQLKNAGGDAIQDSRTEAVVDREGTKAAQSASGATVDSGTTVDVRMNKMNQARLNEEYIKTQVAVSNEENQYFTEIESKKIMANAMAEAKNAREQGEIAERQGEDARNMAFLEGAIGVGTAGVKADWWKAGETALTAKSVMAGGPPQGHGGNPDPRARGGSRYSLSRNQSAFDANLPIGRNVYSKSLSGGTKSKIMSAGDYKSPLRSKYSGYTMNRLQAEVDNRYRGKGFQSNLEKYGKWGFGPGKGRMYQVNQIAKKWKSGKLKRRK